MGADRILVGSAAITNPHLIEQLATRWGSQAVIGSVSTRALAGDYFAVTSTSPSEPALPASKFVRMLQDSGAGEVLINSVDRDGSLSGLDLDAIWQVTSDLSVPYLVAGGVGNWEHIAKGILDLGASGVATSNIYHLTPTAIASAKQYLADRGIPVRLPRQLDSGRVS